MLLYHSLCSQTDKSADNAAVTFEGFKQQMEYLHQNGFLAVSLEKIFAESEYWKGEGQRPGGDTRKKVVLTFDDGDLSHYYNALPTLKEKGFTATFFVTINEIGKQGRMDWPMVYDLGRQGMGVGSHGLTHGYLTAHNNYTVLNELITSKQVLEKYTRKRVDFLSVPRGFYNKRVLTIARDVGFKAMCVSDAGFNDFLGEVPFLLRRFAIRKNCNLRTFRSIVKSRPSPVVMACENARSVSRNVLGYQVYDRLSRMKVKGERPGS